MVACLRPRLKATLTLHRALSSVAPMHTKTIHCGILVCISMLAMCSRLSAQSCGGRPSEKDILALRDVVSEQVTDQYFWFGEGAVPASPIEVNIRVAANPIADEGGGNVLVALPALGPSALGTVSLWRVCGQDFAFVYRTIYPDAITAMDSAKAGGRFSQFSKNEAIKSVNLTMQIRETPDFGSKNAWKTDMLGKIQNALSCFLSHKQQIPHLGQPLQIRVGDFTERSWKVPVEVADPNQMWVIVLPLNSSGIVSAPSIKTIRPLDDDEGPEAGNRLKDHSFPATLSVTDEACGALAGR